MTHDHRRPASSKGVTIHSKGGAAEGVKIVSKDSAEHKPETQVQSRVVEHNEFDKTKRLVEDES